MDELLIALIGFFIFIVLTTMFATLWATNLYWTKRNQKAISLILDKSRKNYNLALVEDSGNYSTYCQQFYFFLNRYKEEGGAFEIWEEDKYTFDEFTFLREVLNED